MFVVNLRSYCVQNLRLLPAGPCSSFSFSISSVSQVVTKNSAQNANQENPVLLNYLINTLDVPKSRALALFNRFHWVRSVENPELVVHFFKSIGFTDAQIQSVVRVVPQILLSNVEKTIKPKIQLFQELGITGSDLAKLISRKTGILTRSLEKTIKPSIEVLNKVLINGSNNGDLFRVLQKTDWVISSSPHLRLIPNILYLESIGIVGSQLSSLLKRQPHLFILPESQIKKLVSRVLNFGIPTDSRMLVHGLFTLSCIRHETILRKLKLFHSFDFSKYECIEMFRRAPCLFRNSEEKITVGLEFFLETVKLKKSTLIQRPTLLTFSMEERVIPRYRVFQLIKSRKLLKKGPSFLYLLFLPEHLSLEKYLSRFTENAQELLMAYKGLSSG